MEESGQRLVARIGADCRGMARNTADRLSEATTNERE
jgi:hypothetical protein